VQTASVPRFLSRRGEIALVHHSSPPMEFDAAGSVFKNREGIEIDFLLASQKTNRIHANEIKRGKANRDTELNQLVGKAARLTFKSIRLQNPQITGRCLESGGYLKLNKAFQIRGSTVKPDSNFRETIKL